MGFLAVQHLLFYLLYCCQMQVAVSFFPLSLISSNPTHLLVCYLFGFLRVTLLVNLGNPTFYNVKYLNMLRRIKYSSETFSLSTNCSTNGISSPKMTLKIIKVTSDFY